MKNAAIALLVLLPAIGIAPVLGQERLEPERPAATAPENRLLAVLQELQSIEYATREKGVRDMLELPPEEIPALERLAAAPDTDPEVAARLQQNMERLRAIARRKNRGQKTAEISAWETAAALKGYLANRPEKKTAPWDADVKSGFAKIIALHDGARPPRRLIFPPDAYEPFHRAIAGRCEDPLVATYCLKTGLNTGRLPPDEARRLLPVVYPAITASHYCPALKLQAVIDYVEALNVMDPDRRLWTDEQRRGILLDAFKMWPAIVADRDMPDSAVEQLAERLVNDLAPATYQKLQLLDAFFAPWTAARPAASGPWALKSLVLTDAVVAPVDTVMERLDAGERRSRVAAARAAGEKACQLDFADSWAMASMVRLCSADPEGGPELDRWFDRAMQANPDDLDVCDMKLLVLESQNKDEAMLEFGRQCAQGGRWKGRIPLILVEAHVSAAGAENQTETWKAYMQRADVKKDITEVYSRIIAAHEGDPLQTYDRSQYAMLCCLAEWWPEAREQFAALADRPWLPVFQSRTRYDYLRKKAERLSAGAHPGGG
jgi:hypothetical protein